jgi:transposase-like protein
MYLMTSTRCGISAKQLERELGVTYKTAWRMANLVRHELMDQKSEVLEGAVEIDETYIGGRRKGSRGGRPAAGDRQKTLVLGMVERDGRVVAMTVENVRTVTLLPQTTKRALPESVVYTDELKSYDQLVRHGYEHNRIYHGAGVYMSGTVHTNTIEGFWSLVKGGIGGVYHTLSQKHLQGYLNEYACRYSNRHNPEGLFRLILLRAAAAGGPRSA